MDAFGCNILPLEIYKAKQHALAVEYDKVVRAVRQSPLRYNNLFQSLSRMGLKTVLGDRKVSSSTYFLPSTCLLRQKILMPESKSPTSAHEGNVAILDPASVKIIENLKAHHQNCVHALVKLNEREKKKRTSSKLSIDRRDRMARRIYGLTVKDIPRDRQHMSFFFHLNEQFDWWVEVSNQRLAQSLGSLWPYPIDECRRQATRLLRSHGAPDYAIEMQQGRFLASNPPYGEQRQLTVYELRDLLTEPLKKSMEDTGWKV